jgi:hypothetical protein
VNYIFDLDGARDFEFYLFSYANQSHKGIPDLCNKVAGPVDVFIIQTLPTVAPIPAARNWKIAIEPMCIRN